MNMAINFDSLCAVALIDIDAHTHLSYNSHSDSPLRCMYIAKLRGLLKINVFMFIDGLS